MVPAAVDIILPDVMLSLVVTNRATSYTYHIESYCTAMLFDLCHSRTRGISHIIPDDNADRDSLDGAHHDRYPEGNVPQEKVGFAQVVQAFRVTEVHHLHHSEHHLAPGKNIKEKQSGTVRDGQRGKFGETCAGDTSMKHSRFLV